MADELTPHIHDDRYMTRLELGFGQEDVRTGAIKTTFGQQRKWSVRDGYSLVLPRLDIDMNAELAIEDGGELTLVGGSGSGDVVSAGLSGGQTIHGGTDANDDLTLDGTSHATKTTSYVLLQPDGGNVGIGTETPEEKLHVSGNILTSNSGWYESENNSGTNIRLLGLDGSNDVYIGAIDNAGGKVIIREDASNVVTITGGNVGIGATPSNKLDVAGVIGATGDVKPLSVQYGLGERHISKGYTPDTHFASASIPTGYAWAGAPFDGTPGTLVYNVYSDYMAAISGTAGGRAFMNRAITNAAANWQNKALYGRFRTGATTEIGLRVDVGNDNTYAEVYMTGALADGRQRLDFRYRLGGGAVTTVSSGVIVPCDQYMGLALLCYYSAGAYSLNGYLIAEENALINITGFGVVVTAYVPAAGRAGVLVKNQGNFAYCDWIKNEFT